MKISSHLPLVLRYRLRRHKSTSPNAFMAWFQVKHGYKFIVTVALTINISIIHTCTNTLPRNGSFVYYSCIYFLNSFALSRKAPVTFIMSVRFSVRLHVSAWLPLSGFSRILILWTSVKSVEKVRIRQISGTSSRRKCVLLLPAKLNRHKNVLFEWNFIRLLGSRKGINVTPVCHNVSLYVHGLYFFLLKK